MNLELGIQILLMASGLRLVWSIVCYNCDSKTLPECAQTLGEEGLLPFKECAAEVPCAMSIVDSTTYRGCEVEVPTEEATYAKNCTSNLCNAGVFPPGRLKCHHCMGASCVEAPVVKPRPCLYHHEEDACYTEVVNANLAYRGCVSDSNHTAVNTAKVCEINGCNAERGAWTLTCASCDSSKGRGCKMDLFQLGSSCNISLFKLCEEQLLLGEEQGHYCYTYHHLSRVVRGCSTQLPAELEPHRLELQQCANATNCNARCLPQQQCLNCNSAEKDVCRSNATAVSAQSCGSAEASSCYACVYDDFGVRRGCGHPPTDSTITNCYECDGHLEKGCNKRDFTRCYRCSSDEAGAGCINWERPGGIYIEQCAVPAAPCLVLSYVNGTVERGCQREDFNCSTASVVSCRSCEGNFCNKGPFPAERLWCHQCEDCEQVISGQSALPCGLDANEPVDQNAACLEFFDEQSHQIKRGCRSQAQLYYECLLRSDKCRLCQSNGCNDTPGKQLRPQRLEL